MRRITAVLHKVVGQLSFFMTNLADKTSGFPPPSVNNIEAVHLNSQYEVK